MQRDLARTLMLQFAETTGILGATVPRRYLWTDAFAVCNFLGLYRAHGEHPFLELAVALVDQVHHVLGRHRPDDSRCGWISGLSEAAGERHPTCGGLRIGKPLHERRPDQPPDPRLEWDRDGQYFHYLTRWMHALDCMSRSTGDQRYRNWAVELATAAYKAFACRHVSRGTARMVWKMSIDLSRPLVTSMGQHDPLDGLMTCLELQSAAAGSAVEDAELTSAIAGFTEMCDDITWATEDPLGIGGLLDNAARLTHLVAHCGVARRGLLERLLAEAEVSLEEFSQTSLLSEAAEQRLAFRELGLSLGLRGIERVRQLAVPAADLQTALDRLLLYRPLAEQIEAFWSAPGPRQCSTWMEHGDINMVMLATSLAPAGYFPLPDTEAL